MELDYLRAAGTLTLTLQNLIIFLVFHNLPIRHALHIWWKSTSKLLGCIACVA